MNRVLVVLLVIAGAAVVAVLLARDPDPTSSADTPPPPSTEQAPTPTDPDAAAAVAERPPPPQPDYGPIPEAVIEAERDGLMNREAELIERLAPRGWTVVGDGWRSPMGTEVRFAIREGRVTGARVRFPEAAFSSALSELTVPLVGHGGGGGAMLPGGEQAESLEPDARPRSGTVRVDGGEYDWTLWLRTTGEAPYGPARFDLGDVGPLDGSPGPGP